MKRVRPASADDLGGVRKKQKAVLSITISPQQFQNCLTKHAQQIIQGIREVGGKTPILGGKPSYLPQVTGKTPPPKCKCTPQTKRVWEDEASAEWLEDGKSPETVRKYKAGVDDLHGFVIQTWPLVAGNEWYTRVKYIHLLAWRKHVITNASKSTKQPRVASVKSLFKCLLHRRHISEDPARDLRLPPKPTKTNVIRYLSRENVDHAIKVAETKTDRGLLIASYHGMLRKKEVRSIKRDDCTFVTDKDGTELLRMHVVGKGRDEKERDVTLSATGTRLLKPIVEATPLDCYLFPGQRPNSALSSTSAYRHIKSVFKAAGLPPKASPHWLRHAGASHAHHNGATLVQLRDMLGHSDVKVTSLYLHSDPDSSCARALDPKEEPEKEEAPKLQEASAPPSAIKGVEQLKQRLKEVDGLLHAGIIDAAEQQTMRADALHVHSMRK